MAKLVILLDNYTVTKDEADGTFVEHDASDSAPEVQVRYFPDDNQPNLQITVRDDFLNLFPRAEFVICGYEDIDALRRYCEMALSHFEKAAANHG